MVPIVDIRPQSEQLQLQLQELRIRQFLLTTALVDLLKMCPSLELLELSLKESDPGLLSKLQVNELILHDVLRFLSTPPTFANVSALFRGINRLTLLGITETLLSWEIRPETHFHQVVELFAALLPGLEHLRANDLVHSRTDGVLDLADGQLSAEQMASILANCGPLVSFSWRTKLTAELAKLFCKKFDGALTSLTVCAVNPVMQTVLW